MPDLILPNPKYERPELLHAGRKPTGPVVIDWENPLTVGMTRAYLFDDVGHLFDHVSGKCATQVDGSRAKPHIFVRIDERGNRSVGKSYNSGGSTNDHFQQAGAMYSGIPAMAYAAGLRRMPGQTTREYSIIKGSSRDYFGFFITDRLSAYISSNNNASRLFWTIPFAESDGYRDVVMSRIGGTDCTGYKDGIDALSTVTDQGLGSGDASSSNATPVILDDIGGAGYCSYMYFWERSLSQVEAESLHKDPYQFFVPA